MTGGCEIEADQEAGYCEACGGNTMMSALVLASQAYPSSKWMLAAS
jgi:hypothetical protein